MVNVRSLVANDATRRRYSLRMPDGTTKVFTQRVFDPKAGFVPVGPSEVQPGPGVPDRGLSYFWYGLSGNETLTVTVHRGEMSAALIGRTKNYSIARYAEQLVFRQFDPARVPSDAAFSPPTAAVPFVAPKYTIDSPKFLDHIDVVVLHTALAATAAGSADALNAAVQAAFDQTNVAIQSSGITSYRLRNPAQAEILSALIDYNEAPTPPPECAAGAGVCRWVGHRAFARTNPTVQGWRNATNADLVVLIVADNTVATGIAYIQQPDCGNNQPFEVVPGCNIGAAYDGFAVAVVSLPFITSFQVFAHETGHQLGMEHNFANASANPSFPWSYGWFVNGQNETIMSVAGSFGQCPAGCPRALQFSNPQVPLINTTIASGTATAWNARTGVALARGTSELRNPQLNALIFRSNFEALELP